MLQQRPPDRRPAFHQAELDLESAKKELYWAHYRLGHARDRLDQFGPISQLRSLPGPGHGRRHRPRALTFDPAAEVVEGH